MSTDSPTAPATRRLSGIPLALGLCLTGLLAACGSQAQPQAVGVPGEEQTITGPGGLPQQFIVDDNLGGSASSLVVTGVFWGRIVDLYDRDLTGAEHLQYTDFLINHLVQGGDDFNFDQVSDFEMETDAITGRERLVVLAPHGSPEWDAAIAWLNDVDNLTPIDDKGVSPTELPPFPFIARNAALMVRFNDLVDPTTVNSETLKVHTGYPPVVPFEQRAFGDPNHGAAVELNGELVFRSTRVLFDMTVSNFESLLTGLSVNELGLPASTTVSQANVVMRIPTVTDFAAGQFDLLRNLSGKPVSAASSGSADPASPSFDVVRAMRSGGNTQITNDAFNGFLPDFTPPLLISRQPIFFSGAPAPLEVAPGEWLVTYVYLNLNCAFTPKPGDLLRWSTSSGELPLIGEVIGNTTAPINGIAGDVRVALLDTGTTQVPTGGVSGEFLTNYDLGDALKVPCFMRTSPVALAPPNQLVDPSASFLVEFNEAMNPDSMRPFDSMMLTRDADSDGDFAPPATPRDYVVAKVAGQSNKRVYTTSPVLPLSHTNLQSEAFFLNLIPSPTGLTDLAGNQLELTPPPIKIELNPASLTQRVGNYVLRFSAEDEDANSPDLENDPWPEIRGQFTRDTAKGIILPRPVSRFSGIIDRASQNPDSLLSGAETFPNAAGASPYDNGIFEPLIRQGSRIMTTWRADDMELKVNSESTYNIDVETLSWAPFGGSSQVDTFPSFRVAVGHSFYYPDGGIENFPGLPPTIAWPTSGLKTTSWEENILPKQAGDASLTVMHPAGQAYVVDPSKGFLTSAETFMQPFPVNANAAVTNKKYYTWRDTAIQSLGGDTNTVDALNQGGLCPGAQLLEHLNNGVGQLVLFQNCDGVLDSTVTPEVLLPGPGIVGRAPGLPSVLMPLLLDFQTAISPGSLGQNRFDFSDISSPSVTGNFGTPMTRLVASGGQDPSGLEQVKAPELQASPNGGFNAVPAWSTGLGAPTPSGDSIVYLGQVDFVVRVSRAHTIWIDSNSANADYVQPVVEYLTGAPPAGTGVELAYRGALSIPPPPPATNPPSNERTNANTLNSYGDVPVNPFTYNPIDIQSGEAVPWDIDVLADSEDLLYVNYSDLFPGVLNQNISFFDTTDSIGAWYTDPSSLDGVKYFQVRVTFISNATSGQSPELSALGFTWYR